jgi:hypothetical protein
MPNKSNYLSLCKETTVPPLSMLLALLHNLDLVDYDEVNNYSFAEFATRQGKRNFIR